MDDDTYSNYLEAAWHVSTQLSHADTAKMINDYKSGKWSRGYMQSISEGEYPDDAFANAVRNRVLVERLRR